MLKIGIFFGGKSREREIAFAGGRTVYDNLDKSLFEAIPIFVDSENRFILLDWKYLYKGTIRDFYPSHKTDYATLYIESVEDKRWKKESLQKIGKEIYPHDFKTYFDVAFLSLHGIGGEDGTLQGLLDWYDIPYSGADIFSAALGIDKCLQKTFFQKLNIQTPKNKHITFKAWQVLHEKNNFEDYFQNLKQQLGMPLVIKPSLQGSSIGVHILKNDNLEEFINYTDKAFFFKKINKDYWLSKTFDVQKTYLESLCDLKNHLGLPLELSELFVENVKEKIFTLQQLHERLNFYFQHKKANVVVLKAYYGEPQVLFESFIKGKEFSCIVIEHEDGHPIALPPTEIIKKTTLYDYKAKYLAGISRKITPIDLPNEQIEAIRKACCELYNTLIFKVYARIDGILSADGIIYLNDPNTTSGMLPSSFFFHQAAEIGLSPSNFLTYILHTSLKKHSRQSATPETAILYRTKLEKDLKTLKNKQNQKIKIALLLGGFSFERHISVESARNIYEKLAASDKYVPIPIFIKGDSKNYSLYKIPINLLLKDNADDISYRIGFKEHSVIADIRQTCQSLTDYYGISQVQRITNITFEQIEEEMDFVFIAMHGRPGEDGEIQQILESKSIPYNGSNSQSAALAMNKFLTNEILNQHGIMTAKHRLITKVNYLHEPEKLLQEIESNYPYPFIVKPLDDGCSAAVKKINDAESFKAFANLIFRPSQKLRPKEANYLNISFDEEFPVKNMFVLETCIEPCSETEYFLEITGGLLTHSEEGKATYEIFKPSEALAQKGVLSLEEKFLAGEGQNITPALYAKNPVQNQKIEEKVKAVFKKTAEILNLQGYARIDAFVRIKKDQTIEVIIIEVNTLPGMTPATCIFHQAALAGYKPFDFIDKIICFRYSSRH